MNGRCKINQLSKWLIKLEAEKILRFNFFFVQLWAIKKRSKIVRKIVQWWLQFKRDLSPSTYSLTTLFDRIKNKKKTPKNVKIDEKKFYL